MLRLLGGVALLQAAAAPWTTATPTAGDWTYRAVPGGSEAAFQSATDPLFTLRCTLASRTVQLLRSGAPTGASVIIRTTSLERTLPASATLGARDPLLDAIAYSRGRWSVEVAGLASLVLPSWPEAARSIEDCRN
ncbi:MULTISPECIES: hypothetical protein [Sphingomonas]|uniref:hypothetical protein n=1 Tax=Sphingomonas TaxID=13687 RepID=UPI000DEEC0B6|nr:MULTISPECIES: hypothetical protein [Sphingomonas]